jgi:hypothetical protein
MTSTGITLFICESIYITELIEDQNSYRERQVTIDKLISELLRSIFTGVHAQIAQLFQVLGHAACIEILVTLKNYNHGFTEFFTEFFLLVLM